MGGVLWAQIPVCSSNTSNTNSRNNRQGKPPTRSSRRGRSWGLASPGLKLAFTQADFLVNIILLIGRIVKRNLRPLRGFLWKSGWSGMSCKVDAAGNLTCFSSNLDDNGTTVFAFHDSRRCVAPDLDHSWLGTHKEANFLNPNGTLVETLSDGFVRVNDATEQLDNGVENATDDQTMSFYNQDEIPFYYNLAANFAVSDRYFSPMLGPTIFRMRRKERASGCSGGQVWTRTFCPFSCFWRRLAERRA